MSDLAANADNVLILYSVDEALCGGHDAEAVKGVHESVAAIEDVLWRADVTVSSAAVHDARSILDALDAARPEVVYNLIESLGGRGEFEAAAAGLLEMAGVEFTGSGSLTLGLCLDKPLAKAMLYGFGLPTAAWRVLEQGQGRVACLDALAGMRYPCIVKPARTDASHGIEPGSVVRDAGAALVRAELLWERYGPEALCEEYVDGREINVAIAGSGAQARCLPLSEIVFRLAPGLPRIVTYAAKWIDGSEEWGQNEVLCPAPLDPDAAERIESVALAAYRAFGCRDYGRVDVRLSADGAPVILEVNPNPDLAPTAGLARSASKRGWSYDELVHRILDAARQRAVPRPGAAAR
jgi:D-alanine-D-alanine ligase